MNGVKNDRAKQRALIAYWAASARAGDRQALSQLAHLLLPVMHRHAARLLGSAQDAPDIVQSAWIEFQRSLPALRDDFAVQAFALRITGRQVGRRIAVLQRDRHIADVWQPEEQEAGQAEANADALTVRAAIAALPPSHRATLALFYLEDLTVTEVAAALDVPVGTVKTRLMHARGKLKATLEGGENVET